MTSSTVLTPALPTYAGIPTRGAPGAEVSFNRLALVTDVEFNTMLAVTVPSARLERLAVTTSCPLASMIPFAVTVWVPSVYVIVATDPGAPVTTVGAALAAAAPTLASTEPPTGAPPATAGGSMNASVPGDSIGLTALVRFVSRPPVPCTIGSRGAPCCAPQAASPGMIMASSPNGSPLRAVVPPCPVPMVMSAPSLWPSWSRKFCMPGDGVRLTVGSPNGGNGTRYGPPRLPPQSIRRSPAELAINTSIPAPP